MPRRLVVIGAGALQVPAIETGRRMGLEVIATDMNPEAPGAALANRFFPVSTVDVEGTVQVARECNVDAVMTLGTDFPMRAVAQTARRLGLPGVSPETAEAATDKYLMCERFEKHGVPCPRFRLVASAAVAAEAAEAIGYPVIVKPTDRSGSVGVSRVDGPNGIEEAFARAQVQSRVGGVLVEEFIGGHEISVETMAYEGVFQVIAITDKLTTGAPYFVEMGHCVPCQLDAQMHRTVCDTARRASSALGVQIGPTHTEMKIEAGRATLIELGARLGGDRITSHLVPLATGVDLVAASIRVALGEQPDLTPTRQQAAAIRYLMAPPGHVTTVEGVEAARELPGVHDLAVEVDVGETLPPVKASGDRPGWVIAVGATPPEAIARAEAARDAIVITTENPPS